MNIVLDQSDITAAERDGHIVFGLSGSIENGPSFKISSTSGGSETGALLRFAIPFDEDEFLQFEAATLYMYWHPVIAYYGAIAGVLRRGMKIFIYSEVGGDAAYPADITEIETQIDAAEAADYETVWWEDYFYNAYIGTPLQVMSVNFAEALEAATIRRSGWVNGSIVNIYIKLDDLITTNPKAYYLYSGTYDADYAPTLRIDYSYDTPAPTEYDELVEHEITVEQLISYVLWETKDIEHEITVEQDISYSKVFGRSIEHLMIVDQDIHIVGTRNFEVYHSVVARQTIEVAHAFDAPAFEHQLSVEQFYTYSVGTNASVLHQLTVEQDISVVQVRSRELEHEIVVQQFFDPSGIFRETIQHVLQVEQTISYELVITFNVEHTLTVQQDISATLVRYRTVEHTINVRHGYLPEI